MAITLDLDKIQSAILDLQSITAYFGGSSGVFNYNFSGNSKLTKLFQDVTNNYRCIAKNIDKVTDYLRNYTNDILYLENIVCGYDGTISDASVQKKAYRCADSIRHTEIRYDRLFADVALQNFTDTVLTVDSADLSKYNLSENQIQDILNKITDGSALTSSELAFAKDYLSTLYDLKITQYTVNISLLQDEFDNLKTLGEKDFKEAYDGAKNLALYNAYQKIDKGTIDLSILGITEDEFNKMSKEDLANLLISKDSNIAYEYQRLDKVLKENGFSSIEEYQDKLDSLEAKLNEQIFTKKNLQEALKTLPYDLEMNSVDYKNFQFNKKEVNLEGLDKCVLKSNVGTVTVNYSKYCEEFGEIDPYTFLKAAQEIYGDDVYLGGVDGARHSEIIKSLTIIENLSPELVDFYLYIYETKGAEEANKYLFDVEEKINNSLGMINAKAFLDSLGEIDEDKLAYVMNHLKISGKGLGDGAEGFYVNLGYALTAFSSTEDRTRTAKEFETLYILQAIASEKSKVESGLISYAANGAAISSSDYIDFTKDYGAFLGVNYQLSQSIGNMAPAMLLSAVFQPLGTISLGVSASGGAYHSAMVEGYSKRTSIIYGVTSGLNEVLTEELLGTLPFMSDANVFSFSSLFKSALKEGAGEFANTVIGEGILDTQILGKSVSFGDLLIDGGISFLYGAGTGLIMNFPRAILNGYSMKKVNSDISNGYVSEADIVLQINELIPDTKGMSFDEILKNYTGVVKDVSNDIKYSGNVAISTNGTVSLLNGVEEKINYVKALKENLYNENVGLKELEQQLTVDINTEIPKRLSGAMAYLADLNSIISQYSKMDISSESVDIKTAVDTNLESLINEKNSLLESDSRLQELMEAKNSGQAIAVPAELADSFTRLSQLNYQIENYNTKVNSVSDVSNSKFSDVKLSNPFEVFQKNLKSYVEKLTKINESKQTTFFMDLMNDVNQQKNVQTVGDLKQSILESMPDGLTDFERARWIYLELGKQLNFDENLNSSLKDYAEVAYEHGQVTDASFIKNNKVVCLDWAQIYSDLLTKNGIENKVQSLGHKWVEFKVDGITVMADATTGSLQDLARISQGDSTEGFRAIFDFSEEGRNPVIDGEPTFDLLLKDVDQHLGYIQTEYNNILNNLQFEDGESVTSKLQKFAETMHMNEVGFVEGKSYFLKFLETLPEVERALLSGTDISRIGVDGMVETVNVTSVLQQDGSYKFFAFSEGVGFAEVTSQDLDRLFSNKFKLIKGKSIDGYKYNAIRAARDNILSKVSPISFSKNFLQNLSHKYTSELHYRLANDASVDVQNIEVTQNNQVVQVNDLINEYNQLLNSDSRLQDLMEAKNSGQAIAVPADLSESFTKLTQLNYQIEHFDASLNVGESVQVQDIKTTNQKRIDKLMNKYNDIMQSDPRFEGIMNAQKNNEAIFVPAELSDSVFKLTQLQSKIEQLKQKEIYIANSDTVTNSQKLKNYFNGGIEAMTNVLKVGKQSTKLAVGIVGLTGSMVATTVNPFVPIIGVPLSISYFLGGLGNTIKNSFLMTENIDTHGSTRVNTINGPRKATLLTQNFFAFSDFIQSRLASNNEHFFLMRSINALQYLEPNHSYGTISQIFTRNLLQQVEKLGYIKNLSYIDADSQSLFLERLQLGTEKRDKPIPMYEIYFETTDKKITPKDIDILLSKARTRSKIDFDEYKFRIDRSGRTIFDVNTTAFDVIMKKYQDVLNANPHLTETNIMLLPDVITTGSKAIYRKVESGITKIKNMDYVSLMKSASAVLANTKVGQSVAQPFVSMYKNFKINSNSLLKSQAQYIENANAKQLDTFISQTDIFAPEILEILKNKIIKDNDILYWETSGYRLNPNIISFIESNPDVIQNISNNSLIALVNSSSSEQSTTFLNEIKRRIDSGDAVFNNISYDFTSMVKNDHNQALSKLPKRYTNKIQDLQKSKLGLLPSELKAIVKESNLNWFNQSFLIEAFANGNIDSKGMEVIQKLFSTNPQYMDSMNYNLLNKSYIDSFDTNYFNKIICDTEISSKIEFLHDNYPKLFQSYVDIVNQSKLDDSLYAFYPKTQAVLNYMFQNSAILSNLNSKLITSDHFVNSMIYEIMDPNALVHIDNFSSNFEREFNTKCDEVFYGINDFNQNQNLDSLEKAIDLYVANISGNQLNVVDGNIDSDLLNTYKPLNLEGNIRDYISSTATDTDLRSLKEILNKVKYKYNLTDDIKKINSNLNIDNLIELIDSKLVDVNTLEVGSSSTNFKEVNADVSLEVNELLNNFNNLETKDDQKQFIVNLTSSSSDVKLEFAKGLVESGKINDLTSVPIFFMSVLDIDLLTPLIGTDAFNVMLYKNFTKLYPHFVKNFSLLDSSQIDLIFNSPQMKNLFNEMDDATFTKIFKDFKNNKYYTTNEVILNKISNMDTDNFVTFMNNYGYWIFDFVNARESVQIYDNFLQNIFNKHFSSQMEKDFSILAIFRDAIRHVPDDNYSGINKIKNAILNIDNSLIESISNSSIVPVSINKYGQILFKIDKQGYYDLEIEVDGKVYSYTKNVLGDYFTIDLNNELKEAFLENKAKIKSFKFNENKTKLNIKASGFYVAEIEVDGKIIKQMVKDKYGYIDLTSFVSSDSQVGEVNLISVDSLNKIVDNSNELYMLSGFINGEEVSYYIPFNSFDNTLDVDNLMIKNNLYNLENPTIKKVSISDIDTSRYNINNIKNSNEVFANIYGGNQSNAVKLLTNDNLSEVDLYKLDSFKKVITKYFPGASDVEMIKLASSYESVGCGYMAYSNALITYFNSLDNGAQEFKNRFGYDLFIDYNGQKYFNFDTLAMDMFLNYNNGTNINDVCVKARGLNKEARIKLLDKFLSSKGVEFVNEQTDYTSGYINSLVNLLNLKNIKDNFYCISSEFFDLRYISGENILSSSNDGALANSISDGKNYDCVGSHAMLLTDFVNGDLIVSSWGNKFKYSNDSFTKYADFLNNDVKSSISLSIDSISFKLRKGGY